MFTGNVFYKGDIDAGKAVLPDALQLGHLVSAMKSAAGLDSLTKTFDLPNGGTVEVVDNQHVSSITITPVTVEELEAFRERTEPEDEFGQFIITPPIRQSWQEGTNFAQVWGEEANVFDAIPSVLNTKGELVGGNAYVQEQYSGYVNDEAGDKTYIAAFGHDALGYMEFRGENPLHTFVVASDWASYYRGRSALTGHGFVYSVGILWYGTLIWVHHPEVPGDRVTSCCYFNNQLIVILQDGAFPTTQWAVSYDVTMPEVVNGKVQGPPVVTFGSFNVMATWDAPFNPTTLSNSDDYMPGSTFNWTFSPDGSVGVKQLIVGADNPLTVGTFTVVQQIEELELTVNPTTFVTEIAYVRPATGTLLADYVSVADHAEMSPDRYPLRLGYTEDGVRAEYGTYASAVLVSDVNNFANLEFKPYYKVGAVIYLPDLVIAEVHGTAKSDGASNDYNMSSVSVAPGIAYGANLGDYYQRLGDVMGVPCVDLRTGTMVACVCTTSARSENVLLPATDNVYYIGDVNKTLFFITNQGGASTVYQIPKAPEVPADIDHYFRIAESSPDTVDSINITYVPNPELYHVGGNYDGSIQVADNGAACFVAHTPGLSNALGESTVSNAASAVGWDMFVATPLRESDEDDTVVGYDFVWVPPVAGIDIINRDVSYNITSTYRGAGYITYANLQDTEGL